MFDKICLGFLYFVSVNIISIVAKKINISILILYPNILIFSVAKDCLSALFIRVIQLRLQNKKTEDIFTKLSLKILILEYKTTFPNSMYINKEIRK